MEDRLRQAASWAAVLIVLLGVVVLVGWYCDVPTLRTVHPSFAAMKANTAATFVLFGIALSRAARGRGARGVRLPAALVVVSSVLTVLEYVFAINLGIDELLIRDPWTAGLPPGRPAPGTAVIFAVLGVGLLCVDRRPVWAQRAALLGALGAFLAVCGYLYSTNSLYTIGPYVSMALHTSVGLLLAALGLLAARPRVGMMAVVLSETVAGRALRRMMPATALLPLTIGWLGLAGYRAGLYDAPFATALWASSTVIGAGMGLLWIGASLYRSELAHRERMAQDAAELRAAHGELQELNRELEDRIEARTQALAASLAERDVLLREVHHRVKNNLQVISSLINLQRRQLDDGVADDALSDCQRRVEAIAQIHEKLYRSSELARVPFPGYVETLIASIGQASNVAGIRFEVDIAPVSLTVDQAMPCGLILTELITNALKHAFPAGSGVLRVSLRALGEGRYVLVVADDGVGLPPGLDPTRAAGLGLRLVSGLVRQLDGELSIDRRDGTTFAIKMTLETPECPPPITAS